MSVHRLIVFTEAVPGREQEFNDWYDQVHLKEVLEVDGFVAAQRFERAEKQMDGMEDVPARFLAIYEIEAPSVEEAMARLGASADTMNMTDAMADGAVAFAYSAIGERQQSA